MRVGIYSLGCKVNLYESEYVESLLKDNGYEIVGFDEKADIYIINTCSVTNESDRKSRKIINEAKRRNSDAIIVVMGCYTQLFGKDTDASIVIGNKDKSKIIELLDEYISNREPIKKIYDLSKGIEFESMEINHFENHTRAFVKIQDGCNAFCSYCIIPYTRGNIRSKREEDVICEVTNLVNNGYKEIVLTGIHTGRYGLDLKDTNLEKFLRKLVKIPNIFRIRLSSIEINEVTDGILNLMKESSIMASHLHIPLQSGCDRILKLMNRRYDLEFYLNRIEEIRKVRDDLSITTDLIVGFPGETDEDFNETLNTLNKIKFSKIHCFPYSKREGTPASKMLGQIDGITKKKRVKQVLELSNKYEEEFYRNNINNIVTGVSEKKNNGTTVIHSSNFIPVVIDNITNNEILRVKITDVKDNNVYGGIEKD